MKAGRCRSLPRRQRPGRRGDRSRLDRGPNVRGVASDLFTIGAAGVIDNSHATRTVAGDFQALLRPAGRCCLFLRCRSAADRRKRTMSRDRADRLVRRLATEPCFRRQLAVLAPEAKRAFLETEIPEDAAVPIRALAGVADMMFAAPPSAFPPAAATTVVGVAAPSSALPAASAAISSVVAPATSPPAAAAAVVPNSAPAAAANEQVLVAGPSSPPPDAATIVQSVVAPASAIPAAATAIAGVMVPATTPPAAHSSAESLAA
jgi:hypothetical protein